MTDRNLTHLVEAARSLESESTVVQLAARALSEACPRGLGLVYTIRGHPARSVGAVVGVADGSAAPLDLERFRRVYGRAQLYYDRAYVEPEQRGRWTDLPASWFRRSQFYPIFQPYGRMGRVLVCLGSRPLACAGVLLPGARGGLRPSERHDLDRAIRSTAVPLRLAALLAQTEALLDGVDYLLSQRHEPAFLLSPSGQILAASAAAQLALERHVTLPERLAQAVRGARSRTGARVTPHADGLELHVTACAPRGSPAGYLAIVSARGAAARERLTRREAELLSWLDQGLTNAGIAKRMGLASSTIKTMLERLYRKSASSGRVALLRWSRSGSAHDVH